MEKLYPDTLIPSAYFDLSKPMRQLITQKWFEEKSHYFDIYVSTLTMTEIQKTKNEIRRKNIKQLIQDRGSTLLKITDQATELSRLYIQQGAIPESEPEDALHIAIATVNSILSLVSWNFKHIVSANPMKKINEINLKNNY